MPGKRRFEEQLDALEQLRLDPPQAVAAPLRKALTNGSNYIVAKAADLVREFRLPELIPDLLAAFDRLFDNPIKRVAPSWAKLALLGGSPAGAERAQLCDSRDTPYPSTLVVCRSRDAILSPASCSLSPPAPIAAATCLCANASADSLSSGIAQRQARLAFLCGTSHCNLDLFIAGQ